MRNNKYQMYLEALNHPFQKLSKLEFLNPDDSVAFALDNNYQKGYRKGHDSRAFIQAGNLNVALQNGQRRKASITLSNLDDAFEYSVNKLWFGDRVRLSMGLILPDGSDFYLPQGVFYFQNPQIVKSPTQSQVSYSLVDKWSYLDGTLFGTLPASYSILNGENIFEAIQKLLLLDKRDLLNGEYATEDTWKLDKTTPVFTDFYNDKRYTNTDGEEVPMILTAYPTIIPMGGTVGELILELNKNLVGWIGYDQTGAMRLDPSDYDFTDAEKPVMWTFTPSNSLLLSKSSNVKNVEVYNNVIIVGEGKNQAEIYGIATNVDPASDTNINLIGKKTYKEESASYVFTEQCINYARWLLKRKAALQKSVSISCSQMFHLIENRLVSVQRSDKAGAPFERHLIQSMNIPIGETGQMTIEAVSVVDYDISTTASGNIGGEQS